MILENLGMTPFGVIAKSKVKIKYLGYSNSLFLPLIPQGLKVILFVMISNKSSFKMNLWTENHAECEHNIVIIV